MGYGEHQTPPHRAPQPPNSQCPRWPGREAASVVRERGGKNKDLGTNDPGRLARPREAAGELLTTPRSIIRDRSCFCAALGTKHPPPEMLPNLPLAPCAGSRGTRSPWLPRGIMGTVLSHQAPLPPSPLRQEPPSSWPSRQLARLLGVWHRAGAPGSPCPFAYGDREPPHVVGGAATSSSP